ncbi:hypothetical protein VTI74DRAFT_1041 [Chaetomium olivicolor]
MILCGWARGGSLSLEVAMVQIFVRKVAAGGKIGLLFDSDLELRPTPQSRLVLERHCEVERPKAATESEPETPDTALYRLALQANQVENRRPPAHSCAFQANRYG